MPDFPYMQTTGRMKDFFSKVPSLAAPDLVTIKWLSSVGFKSKNDRPVIGILEFIGLTASKKPTDRWTAFRDSNQSTRVMAEGIKQGYADLFSTYPDAHIRDEKDLRSFFTAQKPSAGEQVIRKTVNTFKALCTLADFSQMQADESSDGQRAKNQKERQNQRRLQYPRQRRYQDTLRRLRRKRSPRLRPIHHFTSISKCIYRRMRMRRKLTRYSKAWRLTFTKETAMSLHE